MRPDTIGGGSNARVRSPWSGAYRVILRSAALAGIDHQTGNAHARRLLVEAAWHHRRTYRNPGAVMQARWNRATPAAKARGNADNHRLHRRWQTFTARRKKPVVANVAVARELPGWCWSLAVLDDD